MTSLNFLSLNTIEDIDRLLERSKSHSSLIAIYKHSPTCDLSYLAKKKLERDWSFKKDELPVYFIDVIRQRPLSNHVAQKLNIRHESPQILLIKDGVSVYDEDHMAINVEAIERFYANQQ